jgi:ubiquitin C-terminal hydrolase
MLLLQGVFGNFAHRFSGNSQEDAQEFLTYLLDGLHEDLNKANGIVTNQLKRKLSEVENGSEEQVTIFYLYVAHAFIRI